MDNGAVSAILSFRECATQHCVGITIVDNSEVEPHETFEITLNGRISLNPLDGVIITIESDGMFIISYYYFTECKTIEQPDVSLVYTLFLAL